MKTEDQAPPEAQAGADELPAEEEIGIVAEFVLFLRDNKKWWLVPMIVMVVALGALIFLGSSPVAPFIYTLF